MPIKLKTILDDMSPEQIKAQGLNLKKVKVELRMYNGGKRTMRAWPSNPCLNCNVGKQADLDGCCMSYEQFRCDPDIFNGF